MSAALLQALREAVGPAQVLTHEDPAADLSAWEQDWRKRAHGRALAVVRPGSTAEVAAVVRACAAAGTAIVPQGGNTGLVVGSVPDDSGTQVLLSLTRLNAVRAIDPANLTMTVEAGCVLQTLQDAAEKAGFLLPLSLAAEGSCTIGGNLATNAGGTQVVRYGNARDLCLGLEVVTAQGAVWHGLTGLRKDNTGYDLRDLFVGSEGTLGVITAATLKLYPQPAAKLTAAQKAQLADLAMKVVVESVAFCSLNGFPGDSVSDFAAAVGSFEKTNLIRVSSIVVFDGLIPLGPDFARKLTEIDMSAIEDNALYQRLRGYVPENVMDIVNGAAGSFGDFAANHGITLENSLGRLNGIIEFSD